MTHNEWSERYHRMRTIAERIAEMRHERARRLCKAAGLDGGLLNIHPHNAMCSMQHGKPWTGVNYRLVRQCLHVLDKAFEGFRILERWDARVRNLTA